MADIPEIKIRIEPPPKEYEPDGEKCYACGETRAASLSLQNNMKPNQKTTTPPKPATWVCADCLYFVKPTCRRLPPTVLVYDNKIISRYPEPTAPCGEFEK